MCSTAQNLFRFKPEVSLKGKEASVEMLDFIVRLILAILLGAAIGFERQFRQRSAGLRTNTLVSTGAAVFILLGIAIADD